MSTDELDIASLSEVSVLGEGGFDQLVLPDGHGDLVKSMIRQHFRDKKLSAGNVDSSDIVRGKGTLNLQSLSELKLTALFRERLDHALARCARCW